LTVEYKKPVDFNTLIKTKPDFDINNLLNRKIENLIATTKDEDKDEMFENRMRELAGKKMGYAQFGFLPYRYINNFNDKLGCNISGGDVCVFYPERYNHINIIKRDSIKLNEKKFLKDLENELQEFPKYKNINFGNVIFINEARKEFVNKIHKEKNIVDYLVHVRKGRAVIDCLVTISLKYGEDGNIWGYQGIIRDITERKKLEKEVLETSERERFEIGLELHDSLGQLLTGIALKSKSIAQDLEKVLPTKAKDVQKLVNLSNEAIRKTKQIVSGLVPANFGKEGLLRSLEALAIETRNNYGIFCDISSNSCHVELDDMTITQLYRITQEAIINAVKHGNANRVIIALNKANGEIVLSIKDDGVGFAVNNKMFEGRGRRIMAYRARMVDAMLNICKNEDDKGVNIICTLRDKKIN